MPVKELDFTKHNLRVDLHEVKRMFAMHTDNGCRYLLKQTLERLMVDDLTGHLQAQWNQRTPTRQDYRNGYRYRSLLTKQGELRLKVPRDRQGEYQPEYFDRYKRVESVVDEGIRSMFLQGVSTRKVGEVLDALCGFKVSASYVSSVTKELDKLVKEYENSPISNDYAFLFVDGVYVKIRYELEVKRMVLLVAYGIKRDGSRKILSFRLTRKESHAAYLSFLENLKARGLKGNNLDLVVLDGSRGLWSAVEDVYPFAGHQLCWVHKLRNVSKYCPKKYHQQCVSEAAGIMYCETSRQAANRFRKWKKKWHPLTPKAVDCLKRDFDRLIPFFEFDTRFHKVIRTTNVIERCFREVRRRLKVMGYFQNARSCNRITVSLFEYFNHKWIGSNQRIKAIKEYYANVA